jgi:hypothetical protein
MKVKIGDKIYDASEEPIMLILTQEDRKNIENMSPNATKYCAFPDNTSLKFVKEFMKIEN